MTQRRLHHRFDNFRRAYFLLQEALEKNLNQLEKEGAIQRFEYCTELAWKCIKDYLEMRNAPLSEATPRAVIKEAVAAKFIVDGENWMAMLDDKNKMRRTYQFEKFQEVLTAVREKYIHCFGDLYEKLAPLADENGD